jgi:Ca-activated chloride channel family protein
MLAYTTLKEKLHHKVMVLFVMLGLSSQAGVLDFYYLSQAREAYKNGAYEKASHYFSRVESSKARYNAAVSHYKEGNYEIALSGFESIQSADVNEKASLYYNSALCYIRLKEFDKARENLIKSLTLKFDEAAYANYLYIKDATHHEMITGQQEGKKRAQSVHAESSLSSKKRKEGGGSNMNVSADASNSAGDAKMKTGSESMLSFSKNGAKLSSSQYELINERSVNETTPW